MSHISQWYLFHTLTFIIIVSKLEFYLLIFDLWSRLELEINTILPQFQAGPKDILAQKLHSFQLMLNENKQKVSSKQYHYSAEGVFLPALKQHW